MPLIGLDYPSVGIVEYIFMNEGSVSFYHQKVLYPAYFLAIFIGLLTLFKFWREPQAIFFLIFFLSQVLFAFKNQLSGTSYSMRLPLKWLFFPATFLLVASPALYLYFRQYQYKKWKFESRDWLHFLPGLLIIILHAVFFFGPEPWRHLGRYNGYDHYPGLAEQVVFVISGIYYWWLCKMILKERDDLEQTGKTWLSRLLILQLFLVGLWALMLCINFALYSLMSTSLDYHLIWLVVAVFSLWGAYCMLFKKEIVFPNGSKKENRIASAELGQLKTKLERLMQDEKPYLHADLTLQMLADQLGIKEKELSELLNTGFSSNFYNYVNQYRIDAVKTLLLDPEKQHLSNYGIAQEAGFSSKSTFFNLFKKHVGMTPGAFKKLRDHRAS
ncbi:MAG: hypothetical protein DHS20C18_27510 [Saprospiraceae bacterium]|nr:MAG: hypothetical protein DHS20C18_27510 [Saprospiraceae bacterium]